MTNWRRIAEWAYFVAKWGLIGGILWYAFKGIDLASLGHALANYDPAKVLVVLLYSMGAYVFTSLRLHYLCRGEVPFFACAKTIFLGLCLNNLLPAKLGELGKIGYLHKTSRLTGARIISAIFWERFFDINCILLVALASSIFYDVNYLAYPLMSLVVILWGFIALNRFRPRVTDALLKLVPGERLRGLATSLSDHLREQFSVRLMLTMTCLTALITLHFLGLQALGLLWMAEFEMSAAACLGAILIYWLGLAIPSTPGTLGVAEAVMVLALTPYGIGQEDAFAAGLVLHMTVYIPSTLIGLWVIASSGFSIRSLRKRAPSV